MRGAEAQAAVRWFEDNRAPHGPADEGGGEVYVGCVLPPGFGSYLRVLQRFTNEDGEWTTWQERTTAAGVQYHSQISQRALGQVISSPWSDACWLAHFGPDPQTGEALGRILDASVNGARVHGYFELSEIVRGREVIVIDVPATCIEKLEMAHPYCNDTLIGPQYMWPEDRSWLVCMDWDLSDSYLAAGQALAERLLADPYLEILPTTLSERVDYRRDTVNCGPRGLSLPPKPPETAKAP